MVIDAAENGWEMLCDSLAYLKCSVHSRMEWGDHLLVYINLDNSKVPNSDIVRKELYVYLLADNLITNPNLGSALYLIFPLIVLSNAGNLSSCPRYGKWLHH